MKKLLACILLFLFFPQSVLAKGNSDNLSLSDIVYADIATRNYLDNVSIYFTDGSSINDIKLSEGKHWIPASTVKTFAAMYAYKLIAEHKLSLQDTFIIEPKNSVPTELVTDELPTLWEGNYFTADRLIRQMLIQSDNTAFNVLLDVLGRDNITKYIQSLGLNRSNVGSKLNLDTSQEQYEFDAKGYGINTTTAEDYAKAFLLIKNNKIPGAKGLLAILKNQKINNMIPLLLPKEVVCAHKTGNLDPLYHDGGICQGKNESYVLTIFTNAGDTNLLAHLSELIYTKDVNLVGQSLEKKSFGLENQTSQPIDQLVLNPPSPSSSFVLAAATSDFPTQSITASDLGIGAKDLSLVMKDKDLPHVSIPYDSPLHIFSNIWQILKKTVALRPETRRKVDLGIIRLRIAEAKDLEKRGKQKEAGLVLQNMQKEIILDLKDNAIANDSSTQNAIQAASETRFAVLTDELKKAKKEEKIAIIKEIANQAKSTVYDVQPNISNATNATNPSQKPFIGEIVKTSSTQITVKTAGGQELIIPTNNTSVTIQEKQSISGLLLITPTPSVSPSLKSLSVGTTVALFGSTTNNTFSPTLILTKIPKELAAPQPVTVVKVDTKNNTMVVNENGIYTQVNINKNTNIKGADTNIPLSEIKPGDVVIVHGQPLTQAQPELVKPSTTPSPTKKAPNVSVVPSTTRVSPSVTTPSKNNSSSHNSIPTSSVLPSASPKQNTSTQSTSSQTPKASAPSVPNSQPRVIESTSIRILEKKQDVQVPARSQPSQSSAKQTPQTEHKEESKQEQKQKPPEQKNQFQGPTSQPTTEGKKK